MINQIPTKPTDRRELDRKDTKASKEDLDYESATDTDRVRKREKHYA